MIWTDASIGVFIARVVLGILFFYQGYDKLRNVKIAGVISTFRQEMGNRNVPGFIIVISAWFTTWMELIGGILLIAGLFQSIVLALLGLDLILVAGAFSIMKPMWDMQYYFPRLALLIFLLVIPAEWNILSLDYLLNR